MFITFFKTNKPQQLHIDYNNITQLNNALPEVNLSENFPTHYKTTVYITNPVTFQNLSEKQQIHILKVKRSLTKAYRILKPFEENYQEQYYEFKIPKRSGGLRTINAPLPAFKEALTQVKDIFENEIKCLPHDAAYAYVKGRSTLNAVEKHKKNKSNWYLKLDIKDFFPNCWPELIMKQLLCLYPFYYLPDSSKETLEKIIRMCCLNGGLPQGTPMSPLLTNLLMVAFDYKIDNTLKRGTGEHFVYTRYADDMLISCKSAFNWKELQNKINEIIAPFEIKTQKTRYGSKAGSNWNLGLMTNKDNNITLGHRKKKILNAMLNQFLKDFKNNNPWSITDTQVLQGQLSYLHHIEPSYYNFIIEKYEQKYNLSFSQTMKTIFRII